MLTWIKNQIRKYTQPRYSSSSSPSSIDYFRRQQTPNVNTLINNYKRTVYACANLNADSVLQVPLKLYVKTGNGERKARLATKAISDERFEYLKTLGYLSNTLKAVREVEEVIEHPVLELLDKANDSPFLNGASLKKLTQLYLEITGKAYWYIETDGVFNLPTNIWLLPSQSVQAKSKPESRNYIDYYEYHTGGTKPEIYSVDEIIQYLQPNLLNPYTDGLSPLEAAWESNIVSNKLISHESGMLDNEARPDVVISPGKENPWGPDEAKRFEKEFNLRFGKGKGGGAFVAEEELSIHPLNYPPRDLARLEIEKHSRNQIANTFGIPIALLESEHINKATLEAALQQHALKAILPRLTFDSSTKTERLLPFYDESRRLFFAYDNPVPEDRQILLQETVQLVQGGIWTPNEGRDKYKMPPIAGEDKLRPMNQPSEIGRQQARDSGTAEK